MKITGYRILTTIVVLGFGIAKTTLSYLGKDVPSVTLEWIVGVIAALVYALHFAIPLPVLYLTFPIC